MPQLQSTTSLDYNQLQIIAKLQEYTAFKNTVRPLDTPEYILPYDITGGICAGLTAYWLYCTRIKDEVILRAHELDFNSTLQYTLNWDAAAMGPGLTTDSILEEFISFITFFNYDTLLRDDPRPDALGIEYPQIRQFDLDQSFASIQSANNAYPSMATPEFKITFVFNEITLADLLSNIVHEHKMVRVSNNFHTIGLMQISDQYHFYDPNHNVISIPSSNTAELATAIFKAFSIYDDSANSKAIDITIFDLTTADPAPHVNISNYYKTSLQNASIKDMVLKNQYIFELCLWHRTYDLLKVLIKDGVNLNQTMPNGVNLLYMTILEGNMEILYELLNAGADPNIKEKSGLSLWILSWHKHNIEAFIMLLSFGYDASRQDFNLLSINYTNNEILNIANKAIALNKVILNIDNEPQINYSDSTAIINYLHHYKLKKQLGDLLELNHITPFDKNKFYGSHMIKTLSNINSLIKYYKDKNNDNFIDCAAKTELYKLLKFLKPENQTFKGSRELINLFNQISKQIIATPCSSYTPNDLLDIKIILDQLDDICVNTKKTCYIKRLLVAKATTVTTKIKKHLDSLNNVMPPHQPNYLFFASGKDHHKPQISYNTVNNLLRNS